MDSTFAGIEIGKRSIMAHQVAINTTGHNVSNAQTEGYSRQKVTMKVFDPLYIPGLTREERPGQIGQGVAVEKILRARDMLLEDRILSEKNTMSYWDSMSDWIKQVEYVHNEPSDKSILNVMDKFWSSWQELANNPEDISTREAVRQYGVELAEFINHTYGALKSIRDNIEKTIQAKVDQVNSFARQIAKLNAEILKAESVGDNPNDLWDKRDLLVEKLSELADIHVGRSDRDEFMVYIGGKHLVQGKHYEQLVTVKDPFNEGYSDIRWEMDRSLLDASSGQLRALLNARDQEVKYQIDSLDAFAVNITDALNTIHRQGFGLNLRTGLDFFKQNSITEHPGGNFDFNRDGVVDGTAIFRITGTNTLERDHTVGLEGTITLNNGITVDYVSTDTVSDILNKVNNSDADVKMYLNTDGNLVVKSNTPSFYIPHLQDSGDFMVQYAEVLRQSGAEGAFDSQSPGMAQRISDDFMVTPDTHPSSWMGLSEAVKNEVESIAAAAGVNTDQDRMPDVSHGAGDGGNALKIAGLRFERIMNGQAQTLNDFYQALVAHTGLRGQATQDQAESSRSIVNNLENLRKSISGVNIDEELVNLVKYQHGYAAAARFISEVNKMLETLIQRMG
ncbi:MAG: flagellar hook-associated protein FlgK [Spirochaetota bacterium]